MNRFLTLLLVLVAGTTVLLSGEHPATHRPKVGLVLSGGGALGFAHIGALNVIDSLGIPIDFVAGTSFGGLVGGLYAIGYRRDAFQALMTNTDWNGLFSDTPERALLPYAAKQLSGRYHVSLGLKGFTPTLPTGAIAGQKISLLFSRLTYEYAHVTDFDSLPIPFRCMSVDLITGKSVVLRHGPLARAMRATMSFPSVFTPVSCGDSLLIDGGVLNNYPADVLKQMGADIIIGLDVSGYHFSKSDAEDFTRILDRATAIPRYQRLDSMVALTDIYIAPELDGFSIMDFDDASIAGIAQAGMRAAEARMDRLIALKDSLASFHDSTQNTPSTKSEPLQDVVHSIRIVGQERLDSLFVLSLLSLKPGDAFSPDILERQITTLYALGYFETITYTLTPAGGAGTDITLTLRERLFRQLNMGVRYDDYYKLVALIGIRATNLLLPGTRFDSELEFAGLLRSWIKMSYPLSSLDQPIYPYLAVRFHDLPLRTVLAENTIEYAHRSFGAALGIGWTLGKAWNFEAEFNMARSRLRVQNSSSAPSVTTNLRYVSVAGDWDGLDDVFVPRGGSHINAQAKYSQTNFGSTTNFLTFSCGYDLYTTFARFHTMRFKGEFMNASGSLPLSQYWFIGGPDQFIGAEYQQIFGTRFVLLRAEYRYEYRRDIFLKGIVNTIVDPHALGVHTPLPDQSQLGYGIAVMFTSIVGNLELTIARGNTSYFLPHDKQILFHLSAGMKF